MNNLDRGVKVWEAYQRHIEQKLLYNRIEEHVYFVDKDVIKLNSEASKDYLNHKPGCYFINNKLVLIGHLDSVKMTYFYEIASNEDRYLTCYKQAWDNLSPEEQKNFDPNKLILT